MNSDIDSYSDKDDFDMERAETLLAQIHAQSGRKKKVNKENFEIVKVTPKTKCGRQLNNNKKIK